MNSVNNTQYLDVSGPFEARYLAFLETISTLRPSSHRPRDLMLAVLEQHRFSSTKRAVFCSLPSAVDTVEMRPPLRSCGYQLR